MDPRLRTWLVGISASLVALWVGISLAQEEHFIAVLTAGICLWAILAWTRGPLAEAWLLGFLFFGYVVGSRGFAQIRPLASLPLFLSELGLGISLVIVLVRGALQRTLPLRRDWLNGLLLLWLVAGSGRIVQDLHTFGLLALRDFALVYYLLYFFVAQAVASHAPSRRLLHRLVFATFAFLPVTAILAGLFPDFFLSNLLVEDVPLIFYKSDLLATFLYVGFIILLPARETNWMSDGWRWTMALLSLVAGLALLSRASMVGLFAGAGWLAWAGRWRALRVVGAVFVGGLLAVTIFSLLQEKPFKETKAYAIYEAVASITDLNGTRNYESEMTSDKGDNNQFRLIWWRNVARETFAVNPLLGQGFGADLAHGFLAEYYPVSDVDFSARSPHNVFMTTFGRMGFVGATILFGIYFTQARSSVRVAQAARANPSRPWSMTLQAASWVVLTSACFGVVLEGPMGAIPLWLMLGLAHYSATNSDADEDPGF